MATRALIETIKLDLRVLGSRAISTQQAGGLCASNNNEKTHTGQVFDEKDYRNVRFQNATRLVNPQWAIKLIAEDPIEETTERVVSCNGGGGPLGHPKVYINLDKPGHHSCGYCGKKFLKKDDHHH